ncbi:MAG TPA: carbonic anhydrase [Methylococcaceae bacterium]|nr:carbonic anhydrase [Methylococcaceae bacterium]
MTPIARLLLENKAWVQEKAEYEPEFFSRIVQLRPTEILWIGCSDARTHADEITNSEPGTIFVHRNLANIVSTEDENLLCALEYAIGILEVEHIVICGHYGCEALRAVLNGKRHDLPHLDAWLRNVEAFCEAHNGELAGVAGEEARLDRLVELNVRTQMENLACLPILQNAWAEGRGPDLHAWVHNRRDGLIHPLDSMPRQ